MQEKWLNIGKNSKLYGILICPIFISTPSSASALKVNNGNQSPGSQWRGQDRVKLLQSPVLRELLLFHISGDFLEEVIHKTAFIKADMEVTQCEEYFFWVC